jgi:hypothetical protein
MKRLKNKEILFVVMLFFAPIAYGQSVTKSNDSNLSNLISEIMTDRQVEGARELKKEPIGLTDEQLRQETPEKVLSLLKPYEDYNSFSVQWLTFNYEIKIARLHPTIQVRQEVNTRLVNAIFDPNTRSGGDICNWLLSFAEQDFTEEIKTKILNAFSKKKDNVCLIKICGVANIQQVLPQLKELLIDETAYMDDPNGRTPWYYRVGWDARLARARMGVKEDINKCIELADMELDKNLMAFNMYHDIAYIRQPEAIDFLMRYVFSDERLEQLKPSIPGEPVASYVIDILADCLQDFPVKSGGRHYKPEEIELCRKWMSEQKEWKIIR